MTIFCDTNIVMEFLQQRTFLAFCRPLHDKGIYAYGFHRDIFAGLTVYRRSNQT